MLFPLQLANENTLIFVFSHSHNLNFFNKSKKSYFYSFTGKTETWYCRTKGWEEWNFSLHKGEKHQLSSGSFGDDLKRRLFEIHLGFRRSCYCCHTSVYDMSGALASICQACRGKDSYRRVHFEHRRVFLQTFSCRFCNVQCFLLDGLSVNGYWLNLLMKELCKSMNRIDFLQAVDWTKSKIGSNITLFARQHLG